MNTGGPAFPRPASPAHEYGFHKHQDGMTLRDYFAAKAMQGIVANPNAQGMSYREISDRAYTQADAMLKAREQ